MTNHLKSESKFRFRIAPHSVLKEEYPAPYYKFKNPKVAVAFFHETLGKEVKIPRSVQFEK